MKKAEKGRIYKDKRFLTANGWYYPCPQPFCCSA